MSGAVHDHHRSLARLMPLVDVDRGLSRVRPVLIALAPGVVAWLPVVGVGV